MDKVFNIAIIGCGSIAPNHLEAIKLLDNVNVVALCDINPQKAEAMKAHFELNAKIYTDYLEMLNSEKLDAVHVATPHYLHAPMSVEALNRNINVFLEKPMCISRKEIEDMLTAEKNSSAKACVCFQNRYNASTIMAKKVAAEDGGALSAYGCIFWERGKAYYTDSGWRGTYATEGGGVLINQAIHTLDLLCEFLGKPKRLWATKANHHLKGVIEVEDSSEGMIEFENGRFGNFFATTAFHNGNTTTVYVKTKNHVIEMRNNNLYIDNEKISEATTETYVGKAVYGNGHKYLIKEFYDSIKNGTDVPVSLESAQYALRVLLAAYESNDEETII